MDTVFVPRINAAETMELVRELRAKGLAQGPDFSFAYQQGSYDYIADHRLEKGCTFTFKDPKWATFFRMKYGC